MAAPYNELLAVTDTGLILRLPEDLNFNGAYEMLQPMIEANIKGIKKREYDINFGIYIQSQPSKKDIE